MNIKTLNLGALGTNCYILEDAENKKCAIIDPADNVGRILQETENLGLEVSCILITHAHFDHILALNDLYKKTGARVYIGHHDKKALKDPALNLSGYMGEIFVFPGDAYEISEGSKITFGNITLKVIETPGHTPGGVCYISEKDECIFTGDTVFAEGIGRCDFPGGSYNSILTSLNRVLDYPENYTLYPGHGHSTTIKNEKYNNPYYRKGQSL